ncbi:MAG TPA: hypothetical protein VLK85_17665 [Ramlibacter sp.]|nr:hypothetical protein [Ramlibacter sp.]
MLASEPVKVGAAQPSPEAEAARYALLRRLAPSMRHHLVVNLQPIGMIYEVLERRLRAPQPDLAHVQDSANKINGFARAALNSSLEVVGWLAPDEAVPVAVEEGARECASLLATSFSFRGYSLRNEVAAMSGQVRRSTLRSLLTGALILSTDHLQPPVELVLAAEPEKGGVLVSVTPRVSNGDKGFANEPGYRKLEWQDLQALAAEDGVRLERQGERLEIHLPWLEA